MAVAGFLGVLLAVILGVMVVLILANGLVKGENGYSLSKLQLLCWTILVSVSYLIYLWHLQRQPQANFNISASANLLLLVGINAGSYIAAKGVRQYQFQKGSLMLRSQEIKDKWVNLISDNAGNLDLSKLQMLIWTLVALSAYVVELIHALPRIDYQRPALPEVSDMLVFLMGISQAAYIGKKTATDSAPSPSLAAAPAPASAAPQKNEGQA